MDWDGMEGEIGDAVRIGADRLGSMDRQTLAVRASSKGLREMWCRIFRLDATQTAEVLRCDFPPEAQWWTRPAPVLPAVTKAPPSFASIALGDQEWAVITSEAVMHWVAVAPAKRERAALRVLNSGKMPEDWEVFGRQLRPWIQACTPPIVGGLDAAGRIAQAVRFWRGAIDVVYDNARLNGTTPGLKGCSLEWLSSPVRNDAGRKFPAFRLRRVLEGYYKTSEADKRAMETTEANEEPSEEQESPAGA